MQGAARGRPAKAGRIVEMPSNIRYELPALGYDYDALEPAYSAELLELHYASHHLAYVTESKNLEAANGQLLAT